MRAPATNFTEQAASFIEAVFFFGSALAAGGDRLRDLANQLDLETAANSKWSARAGIASRYRIGSKSVFPS